MSVPCSHRDIHALLNDHLELLFGLGIFIGRSVQDVKKGQKAFFVCHNQDLCSSSPSRDCSRMGVLVLVDVIAEAVVGG
jgi:hypothetical protein